jgi:hypothetical protein
MWNAEQTATTYGITQRRKDAKTQGISVEQQNKVLWSLFVFHSVRSGQAFVSL